ncbi:transglutaminase family protein [Fulvimarina sp. MAC3]|uniref:transglutaminase family protein n=1 Tax=Fulvimarina sp. MAC3 TaxID=3148887 RepID=UPI0031FD1A65
MIGSAPPLHLTIRHRTAYRYHQAVGLNAHRMMLRPRESHELHLFGAELQVSPDARINFTQDVFGNTIATASFSGMTDRLVVVSTLDLELSAPAWPIFAIEPSAISYPFRYSDAEWADLGMLSSPSYPDADKLRAWAEGFVHRPNTDTLSLLKDISTGVSNAVSYQSREEEGTQSPLLTLQRGWGSCRDLAVLFTDAVRCLGFGARIVSGYLYNPFGDAIGSEGGGSTHAWTEVYVPGSGWIVFDPTNRSVGGFNLIPVAVARHIDQVMPVSGSFQGSSDSFAGMTVDVEVTGGPSLR